jgi:hypothetical protein
LELDRQRIHHAAAAGLTELVHRGGGTQLITSAPGGSTNLTQGAIDSSGTYVLPVSLYRAQLTQRLGAGVIAQ